MTIADSGHLPSPQGSGSRMRGLKGGFGLLGAFRWMLRAHITRIVRTFPDRTLADMSLARADIPDYVRRLVDDELGGGPSAA